MTIRYDALYQSDSASNIGSVKFAPRLRGDIHISLKQRGGRTHHIELVRQPVGRWYWVRRDGKYSTKVPDATPSQIAEHIRRWLVANT